MEDKVYVTFGVINYDFRRTILGIFTSKLKANIFLKNNSCLYNKYATIKIVELELNIPLGEKGRL
ncbi:hypothetical protein LCGC14_2477460 [marine sediment metagenome]|uniref:Uncharacterized protein n=1 Tax=marine sediment metagenome TaxID=412755 RepID=A0A0F9B8K8_9ZZZZ